MAHGTDFMQTGERTHTTSHYPPWWFSIIKTLDRPFLGYTEYTWNKKKYHIFNNWFSF